MDRQVTAKQMAVLLYIIGYFEEHGRTPTLRTIGDKFGFKSRIRSSEQRLSALSAKGYLRREGKALVILRNAEGQPATVRLVPQGGN